MLSLKILPNPVNLVTRHGFNWGYRKLHLQTLKTVLSFDTDHPQENLPINDPQEETNLY